MNRALNVQQRVQKLDHNGEEDSGHSVIDQLAFSGPLDTDGNGRVAWEAATRRSGGNAAPPERGLRPAKVRMMNLLE